MLGDCTPDAMGAGMQDEIRATAASSLPRVPVGKQRQTAAAGLETSSGRGDGSYARLSSVATGILDPKKCFTLG